MLIYKKDKNLLCICMIYKNICFFLEKNEHVGLEQNLQARSTVSWAYLNGVAIHMPWMILLEDPGGLGSGFQSWIPIEFGFIYNI